MNTITEKEARVFQMDSNSTIRATRHLLEILGGRIQWDPDPRKSLGKSKGKAQIICSPLDKDKIELE